MEGELIMDIALTIDNLLPAATYTGTFTDNTEAEYDALDWTDAREKPAWSAIVSKDTVLQLEIAKDEQKELIRENFYVDTLKQVQVEDENGVDTWWNGGFDSAVRLDAALRLTQKIPGYTTCVIHDYFNESHTYTFSGVDIITVAIGASFQYKFGRKEALLVAIDSASGIEDVQNIVW